MSIYLEWVDDVGCIRWTHYEGMVTALLQLHDEVNETRDASFHTLAQSFVVLGEYPATAGTGKEEGT